MIYILLVLIISTIQVTPCGNRAKRGSLFCHNHSVANGWDGKDFYEILTTGAEYMDYPLNALAIKANGKPCKCGSRQEIIKLSGENILDEAAVRNYNQFIFDSLRSDDEGVEIHRLITNHPTAYHLVRACYNYRLMIHIISVLAEKQPMDMTIDQVEAELVEKFALFLNKKCHAKLNKRDSQGRAQLCEKTAMMGDLFCSNHCCNRPGHSHSSSLGDIYLSIWEEGYRHFGK